MVDAAADVAAIADGLGIERFAVLGGSGGTGHALATAATLPERVTRVAVTVRAAPYTELGHDAFTAGMNPRLPDSFGAILKREEAMTADFAAEDANQRDGASPDNPDQVNIFEQTRAGLGGWIDDETANTSPWVA